MHAMLFSGTGFSREGASACAIDFRGVNADAFPAKASATNSAFSQFLWMHAMLFSGTGFSREEASVRAIDFAV
jgi:hypothetical protein